MADEAGQEMQFLVCQGTGCRSANSDKIKESLDKLVEKYELENRVNIKGVGCPGLCQQGPLILVEPNGLMYCKVEVDDVEEIVESHILKGNPVERLFYHSPDGEMMPEYEGIPFYSEQERVILRDCGHIDPSDIKEYIEVGGYKGLRNALQNMKPGDVIAQLKASGLRGRGGAGFPTGLKWDLARAQDSETKYVICNADEGDPGAFMDGSILVANPHSVIEGLIIAAYGVGATEGFFYVRHEYPAAVAAVKRALDECRKQGFLGEGILDSTFDFDIHIAEGAGAFVCGEETALMESIQGKRGMPRPRPPYPVEKGLWGKPTVINNVKTLASVAVILRKGAEYFSNIGTKTTTGTAIFSLAGKVVNTGLIEVPMGTTLRKIIFDIGGGINGGKKFKAVQTGGPAGGCLPAEKLDLPVDFDSLEKAGAIMGSGGMIVMDEDTCMVDVAHYFLSFTQSESCGKCIPCRVGTRQMLEILNGIRSGEGKEEDLDTLIELCSTVREGSLCGLGKNAPNPVLTTIQYFRDEYEAHIKDKTCPAMVCHDLVRFEIDSEACIGCEACVRVCPSGAASGEKGEPHVIRQDLCIKCGACLEACPSKVGAIRKTAAYGADE